MQFISDLTFLQKLNLKPNHEFGVSAINVCEDIWELIKGPGSYSPDMLKSNYRSLRSLVSSLDSSSFLIPEHLFASPLACSRSISLFFVFPGYHVGSVWKMCLFVSSGNFSPLTHRERNGRYAPAKHRKCLRRAQPQTDRCTCVCVCSLVPGDLDRFSCNSDSIKFRKWR